MKKENFKSLKDVVLEGRQSELKVIDRYFLMDVITTYSEGKFVEMTNLINEYGEHKFFQQLFMMFDDQNWRSQINKYMNFVGITIQYMKFKDLQIELPQDGSSAQYCEQVKTYIIGYKLK